jgi:putative transposase
VERLMRCAGISGVLPRKRRCTTVGLPGLRVAPDLVERDFRPDGPNLTWSADITYISTWEGFLYLAHVQDLFSRLIVGGRRPITSARSWSSTRWRWRFAAAAPSPG